MHSSDLLKAGALALLAMLIIVLPATARIMIPRQLDDVTVVLPGGWELSGMTVEWSETDGGLWVRRPDGARRLYRPAELAGLRDTGGGDITAEVMPAWAVGQLAGSPAPRVVQPRTQPQSPPPTPVPGEIGGVTGSNPADDRQESRALGPWRFLLGVEGGWGQPLDNDFSGADGGLGADAILRLRLVGPLFLAAGYSWQSLSATGYDVVYYPDGYGDYYTSSDDRSLYGYWGGLSMIADNDDPAAARFYFEGGVGRYAFDSGELWDSDAANATGYRAGFGFLIPTGSAAVFDFGFRGLHVTADSGYAAQGHTLVAFHLGLSFLAR